MAYAVLESFDIMMWTRRRISETRINNHRRSQDHNTWSNTISLIQNLISIKDLF